MQYLHADAAALGMDGVGDHAVMPDFALVGEHRGAGEAPPLLVGRDAAGDDQPDSAARAGGVEGGEAREAIRRFLEAGMHRTHQHAIGQRTEPQIEGSQQMRERARGHGNRPMV